MGVDLDLGGNFGWGGTRYESMEMDNFNEFAKALQAGYGTDHASLTGGAAIRVESLDATLFAVTQTQKHFVLWGDLAKSRANATVDEWVRKPSTGGFVGSAFNSELGDIQEKTGTYTRKTASVKYLMTRRSVSFVQLQQRTIIASEAEEQVNGTLELLQSVEHSLYYGNSTVIAEQFDGLKKIMTDESSPNRDARGGSLDPNLVMDLAAEVSGFGKWGQLTNMYLSHKVQADLDINLDPAFRVPLTNVPDGGIKYGAPVAGMRTSWGDIVARPAAYVRESWAPFEIEYTGLATSVDPTPPVSAVAASVADTTAKWGSGMVGLYYWAVASVSRKGVSTVVKSGQTASVAGEKMNITITKPVAADATGYYVYRTGLGDTNATANFRFIGQIADSGGATTVYVDRNFDIPGTSDVFLLNLGNQFGPMAVSIRQLLPMTKFALFPSAKAEVPWAQLLFLYMRVTKPEQCAIIKNVLPTKATWKPFQVNS